MWVCRIGWSGIVSIGDQIQMVSERNIAANAVANSECNWINHGIVHSFVHYGVTRLPNLYDR